MIPEELLTKYNLPSLNEFLEHMPEKEAIHAHYKSFLVKTDYEIIKAYEKLMTEPSKFLTNLVAMYKSCNELVKWRMYAREELEKLAD